MNPTITAPSVSVETARCPYCREEISVELPGSYRPVYRYCSVCGRKFIAERLAEGFEALTLENAPCTSDPDCREIEMAGYDEE